jgi:hypothetical protein
MKEKKTVRWSGLSRQKTALSKVDLPSVIDNVFYTFSPQNDFSRGVA